jgi:all-trans-nonaprenyl-diphosphate synthase
LLLSPFEPPVKAAFELVKGPLGQVKDSIASIVPPESMLLSESVAYSLSSGGKYLRPLLTLLCGKALSPQTSLQAAMLVETAAVAEMIHVATLLHDDVIDQSDMRRGRQTVSKKWGNRVAILSGDYLLAQASIKLSKLNQNRLVSIFSYVLADLCDGEVEQLHTSFTVEPSWESYYKKNICKTASLFSAGCESAGVIQQLPEENIQALKQFGHHFGLAFQIMDDLLDYTAQAETLGKPVFEDLKNGLLTAPVLLALASEKLSNQEKTALKTDIQTLFKTPEDIDVLANIQTALDKSEAIKETRQLVRQYLDTAAGLIGFIADSDAKTALLNLLEYSFSRSH